MPPRLDREEQKVQNALNLMKKNPEMKAKEAVRETRASYPRVLCHIKGVPASSTRGGHNKKLTQIGDNVLKDYLHMCCNGVDAPLFCYNCLQVVLLFGVVFTGPCAEASSFGQ